MNNLETITISVDSSYKEGKAATAYYIKHEKFVVKDSEYLGDNIEGSVLAEYLGIVRAFMRMLTEIRDRVIKKVYVTCDCKPAHPLFQNWLATHKELLGTIQEVIIQHIDAHSGTKSPRQYINN